MENRFAIVLIAILFFISMSIAARIYVDQYLDNSSEEHQSDEEVSVAYHLSKRLIRFIRLGAMAQTISFRWNIPRSEIFKGGAIQNQDIHQSGDYHAAHVVRVKLGSAFHSSFLPEFENAVKFLGHTHKLPNYINLGIDKIIDKIQSDNVTVLKDIDFCATTPTLNNIYILSNIKHHYIAALGRKINKLPNSLHLDQLLEARRYINDTIDPAYLFTRARNCGLDPLICDPPTVVGQCNQSQF